MKQMLLLILFMCGLLSATQRTWNGTDFGGTIGSTDTLIWDGTSSVNWTASSNLVCGHVDIRSTYTGNWVMTGYSLTLSNGGLLRSGSGTFTLGTGLTFNGNGKLYTNATSGTNTSTSCIITFNGDDTTDIDKELSVRGIIVNGSINNIGSASMTIVKANPIIPVVMGASGKLEGAGTVSIRSSISFTPFDLQLTSVFNPAGIVFISCFNNAGTSITITLPAINSPLATISMSCIANGGAGVYEFTGDFICKSAIMITGSANVNPMTFNTNGYLIKAGLITFGSNKAGVKSYVNIGSSTLKGNTLNLSQYQLDSTIITCDNAVLDFNYVVNDGAYSRIDGAYTIAKPTDLFMGHSMLTAINGYSPAWFYEENYSHRVFKNRAVGGTKIDNVFSRVDSCLTAYTPNRFFMWIGTNDLNFSDATQFDSAVALYFTYWTQIISKVKTSGVDSIYIVDMPPRHDVGYMSATKQTNFKRFNSALKDSAFANGCYFIETYGSLLQPGYTDRINPLYATDGLHPNSTIAGSEYCAYLFSLAQKVTKQKGSRRFNFKFGFGF